LDGEMKKNQKASPSFFPVFSTKNTKEMRISTHAKNADLSKFGKIISKKKQPTVSSISIFIV